MTFLMPLIVIFFLSSSSLYYLFPQKYQSSVNIKDFAREMCCLTSTDAVQIMLYVDVVQTFASLVAPLFGLNNPANESKVIQRQTSL